MHWWAVVGRQTPAKGASHGAPAHLGEHGLQGDSVPVSKTELGTFLGSRRSVSTLSPINDVLVLVTPCLG